MPLPAPLWRRLAAALYDGLLLIGLWMTAALVEVIVRDQLLGLPRNHLLLQLYFFIVGSAFFGWFWVRGGQTLGMRAWRLRLRRLDGSDPRWPTAVIRYAVMLLSWGVAVAPLILQFPRLSALDHGSEATVAAALLVTASLVAFHLDARHRAPADFMAGTEVVVLAK